MQTVNGSSLLSEEKTFSYVRYNSYCSEQYKIFYVATPKVACTSLKWWFAELEGYLGLLSDATAESAESAPELIIHDMLHKVAPEVAGLTSDMVLEVLNSDEYFRFAIVRNPYKRIFSAWQSKLLLQEPLQSLPYLQCDFFQRPIECKNDISVAFEGFLKHLAHDEAPNFLDIHWAPQASLLRPDLIGYSKLAKIEDTKDLCLKLSERLGPNFIDPFTNRHTNESLIPFHPMFVTERSAELICHLYTDDFHTFDYSKQLPEAKGSLSKDQFNIVKKAIGIIRGRHQRLGERNMQINTLTQKTDLQIEHLGKAVAERDRQIEHLTKTVTERDKQIGNLGKDLALRDEMVNERNQMIAERDLLMVKHNQAIAEHDEQINLCNQVIAERDLETASYTQELDRVLRSLSWRITKPLRQFHRYFEKLVTVIRRIISLPPQSKQELKHEEPAIEENFAGKNHKILLVVHEFSLTGAPRATLYLAKAIFERFNVSPEIISPVDGPIREEFESNGFPATVAPWLLNPIDKNSEESSFLADFDHVIVTSLSSYFIVRYVRKFVNRLTWWIHEDDAGFKHIEKYYAPDLISLFDACHSIWLGSPVCSLPVLRLTTSDKIHPLLYGCEEIELPAQRHNSARIVFTLVGTIELRKAQDIFLSAIERLPVDLRAMGLFRIIGSPRDEVTQMYCQDILARVKQIPEVEYLTSMPFDQLLNYYADTDVMVSVSRADPMPIVITQGLMFSKPCLCSSSTGQARLLKNGENAFIFENESVDDLIERIEWILKNTSTLPSVGVSGRKVYEKHFLMSFFCNEVEKLLLSKN